MKEEMTTLQGEDSMEHLQSVIRGIPIAMMTTVGGEGKLFSRPMLVIDAKDPDALWFFAHDSSVVVRSIVRNPQVNLSYVNADDERYISVAGRAERIIDRGRAASLWVNELKDYFPNGLQDQDLVLLRIEVDTAEYWDQPPMWLMKAFRMSPILPDRPATALI